MNENSIINTEVTNSPILNTSKKGIQLLAKEKTDSTFVIYIKNNLDENLLIIPQDNSLYIIQEAQNEKKEWKPIEFFGYSTCGNSYDRKLDFNKSQTMEISSRKYLGNFKTKIRFKLLMNNKIYYSNSIVSTINKSKFKKSKWFYELAKIYGKQSEKDAENLMFLNDNP